MLNHTLSKIARPCYGSSLQVAAHRPFRIPSLAAAVPPAAPAVVLPQLLVAVLEQMPAVVVAAALDVGVYVFSLHCPGV